MQSGKMLPPQKVGAGSGEPVYPVGMMVESIKAQFMLQKQYNQQNAAECQAQTDDLDQVEKGSFPEIPDGKLQCHCLVSDI
jgi:hypothetical protein